MAHTIFETEEATEKRDSLLTTTSWAGPSDGLDIGDWVLRQEQIRWYLEDFAAKDPLASQRASDAHKTLRQYCESIQVKYVVDPDRDDPERPILVDIVTAQDKSHMHMVPWEAMEVDPCFVVRRQVKRACPQGTTEARSETSSTEAPDTFNILLVAARASKEDSALYGQVAQPLVRILDSLPPGSPTVKLCIARPGTFDAFKEHLKDFREKGERYQLVHFDLHGTVNNRKASLQFADRSVKAQDIAQLLVDHGVTFAVLNACNSATARTPRQPETNLARVLVEQGVPHVLAMSYRLQISAVGTLVTAFYQALLGDRASFALSAAIARRAMRNEPGRAGRFGIKVDVMDWIVPVVYTSRQEDPKVVSISTIPKPPTRQNRLSLLRWSRGGSSAAHPMSGPDHVKGLDSHVLDLETRLARNEANGVNHPLLLTGARGCGKTTLLRHLAQWWTKTGWMSRVVYVDLHNSRANTPVELKKVLKHALGDGGTYQNGTERAEDAQDNEAGKILVIVDHFEVGLPAKLKAAGLEEFKSAADSWRQCLAELSAIATYMIVASYHFPWYIDRAEDTTWPWTAFHELEPPTPELGLVAEVAGTEQSLRGILGSPRDCEVFTDILKWSAVDVPLHHATVSLCRSKGVLEVARLLRSNTDLLSVDGFHSATIKQSTTYQAARSFWKQCTDMEKNILIGFSPFHGALPRCVQSYAVSFALGELRFGRGLRDHLLRHAPASTVNQYWASANTFQATLAVLTITVLIFKLKKLGFITAKIALGPAPTLVPEIADRLYDEKGTKIYAIHPVFSIFLRHRASKEGYKRLGTSEDEKTLLLTRLFVDYHEQRSHAWMGTVMTPRAVQWDTYGEFLFGKASFAAALEIQLQHPQLFSTDEESVEDGNGPAPLFLAWCLMTASGFNSQFIQTRFSPDQLREWCEAAWPTACSRLRTASRLVLQRRSTLMFLSSSLSACLHIGTYIMEHYLRQGQHVKVQQYMAGIDGLLDSLSVELAVLRPLSPLGFLGVLLEIVEAFRAITSGKDLCPELGYLEVTSKRRLESDGPGWDAVHKIVSLSRKTVSLMQRFEQLHFWDETGPSELTEDVKSELDQLVLEELEPVWDEFLEGLDDELLGDLQLLRLDDANQAMMARIVRGELVDMDVYDVVQDMQDLCIAPPDFVSARIRGIRCEESLATTNTLYQEALDKWRAQPNRHKARMQLYEDTTLKLPDEATREAFEMSQIRTLMATSDYEPLLEYLDLVANDSRFVKSSLSASSGDPGQVAEAARKQVVRKAQMHNYRALCGLMLGKYDLTRRQLEFAFETTLQPQHHSEGHEATTAILLATCRLYMALYRKVSSNLSLTNGEAELLQSMRTARPYHELLAMALELGYKTHEGVPIYACNGALLSLLLEATLSGASIEPDAREQLVSAAQLSGLLKRLLPRGQSPAGYLARLETMVQRARAPGGDSMGEESARGVMKEAETHLMQHGPRSGGQHHCQCQYGRQDHDHAFQIFSARDDETEIVKLLDKIGSLLPRFRGLEVHIEMPWFSSIAGLSLVWMKHVVKQFQKDTGGNVTRHKLDEGGIQEYLSEWHAEFDV